jgi:hypothetical protein
VAIDVLMRGARPDHGLRERTAVTMKRTVVLIVAGLATSGFSVLQLACGGGDSDAAEVASETELKFTLTSPITITERK